jgi:hypothetical protein
VGGHLAWPRRKRLELEGRTRTWSTAAAGWRWSTRRRPSMAEVRAGGRGEERRQSFLLGPWGFCAAALGPREPHFFGIVVSVTTDQAGCLG